MKRSIRSLMITLSVVLTFAFSAIWTIPVLADDITPPPAPTPEVVLPIEDTPVAEGIPTTQPILIPDVLSDEGSTVVTEQITGQPEATLLSQIPENTDVIVLNENGDIVPLATQEASEIITSDIDPMWCPASVAVPTANKFGCTNSFASFTELFNALKGSNNPKADGIIWVSKGYDASINSNLDYQVPSFILDGSNISEFKTMSGYKLTIKGGWNGNGIATVDTTTPSKILAPLQILNWKNDVTLSDLVFDLSSGVTSGDGLIVQTTKNIKLDRVSVNGNVNGGGANLDNSTGASTVTVTINNRNTLLTKDTFSGNNGDGLKIHSTGKITLANIIANNNNDGLGNGGNGLNVDNAISSTKQGVTLSGLNEFKGNLFVGLYVKSSGLITVTDVTASNNGDGGAYLYNADPGNSATIVLAGTNIFNDNLYGLQVLTNGALNVSNLYVNSNLGFGANLSNANATPPQAFTIKSSQFKFNGDYGLQIASKGLVTITNVTANSNGGVGISVDNTPGVLGVTLTSTVVDAYTFNNNGQEGIKIHSRGAIVLNNIIANNNGLLSAIAYSAEIDNALASPAQNVTLTGTNTFNNNHVGGLYIHTVGSIVLTNINANGNGNGNPNGSGVVLSNEDASLTSPKAVTLNGTNVMSNNKSSGLSIETIGLITINSLTANGNGSDLNDAVILSNIGANIPLGVTLTGNNFINNNYKSGLVVTSKGLVKINSLTASGNGSLAPSFFVPGYGVDIDNTASSTFAGVNFTGTNSFIGNYDTGLRIQTDGAVNLVNLVAQSTVNGDGVNVNNQTASTLITPQNVTISGANNFSLNSGNGLSVFSYGIISVANVVADQNGSGGTEYGILLDNHAATVVKPVSLTGVNLVTKTDGSGGVYILSKGVISVAGLTASETTNGDGAYLYNAYPGFKNGITVTGINKFIGNSGVGLNITSLGTVTTNNVTTTSNHLQGMNIDADNSGAIGSVNVIGTNVFNNNYLDGLNVVSLGVITINNVTANQNGLVSSNGGGATLSNKNATLKNVVLTGSNIFTGNYYYGLSVETSGAITSSSVLTSNNTANAVSTGFDSGIYLNNTFGGTGSRQPITLSGKTTVLNNSGYGLNIVSSGLITVNGLTATGNALSGGHYYGAYLNNVNASTSSGALGVTLGGINNTSDNSWEGIFVTTKGAITVGNLTANGNGLNINAAKGAILDNSSGTIGVTMTGVNTFNGNKAGGLDILTNGAVSLNSITASDTKQGLGVTIDNASNPAAPQNVTFTGLSVFNSNFDTGAEIKSYGVVTFNGVTANFNGLGLGSGYGISVDNYNLSGTLSKNVVFNGTNTLNGNQSGGLTVVTLGSIVINNLTASGNVAGDGVYLKNDISNSTSAVTLTGTNKFENNYTNGLKISSLGAITLSNIISNGNGHTTTGYGVYVENYTAVTPQKVTFTGSNTFNSNKQAGLYIHSKGAISLNSVTANTNGTEGVNVDNDEVGASGGVTFTGNNTFTNNLGTGLKIVSQDVVSIAKVVSNNNTLDGLAIVTTGNVTLTCGNFVKNTQNGWSISSPSVVTLIAVVSSGNGVNTSLTGGGSLITVRNCPLP
ncbi:MAG: right-handed parallel beta-helix repeat-containing protein [Anaerolineales bacterium]